MSDAIEKSKRILALVDEYHDKPTSGTRTELRIALMNEFEQLSAQSVSAVQPVAWFEQSADGNWFLAYSHNPNAVTRPLIYGDTRPADADAVDAKIAMLTNAIEITLRENAHLADGEDCTLIHLKRAIAAQSTEGAKG